MVGSYGLWGNHPLLNLIRTLQKDGDVEGDSLEREMGARKKRDIDMSEFFEFLKKSHPLAQVASEGDATVKPDDSDDDTKNDMYYIYGEDRADDDKYGSDDGGVKGGTGEGADADEEPSYHTESDLPDFSARGTYSLKLVGQRRMRNREKRGSVNHLELSEATQSTLMTQINQS